jgi:hypothetical protein
MFDLLSYQIILDLQIHLMPLAFCNHRQGNGLLGHQRAQLTAQGFPP